MAKILCFQWKMGNHFILVQNLSFTGFSKYLWVSFVNSTLVFTLHVSRWVGGRIMR